MGTLCLQMNLINCNINVNKDDIIITVLQYLYYAVSTQKLYVINSPLKSF